MNVKELMKLLEGADPEAEIFINKAGNDFWDESNTVFCAFEVKNCFEEKANGFYISED